MARRRITATGLQRRLLRLLPLLGDEDVDVVLGTDFLQALDGLCWNGPPGIGPRHALLLIDPLVLRAGWHAVAGVAIHEYAHAIRGQWTGAFPFGETVAPRLWDLIEDDAWQEFGMDDDEWQQFGPRDAGDAAAFGGWINLAGSPSMSDPWQHDAFFWFVHYFLSRRAHEQGWFSEDYVLIRSRTRGTSPEAVSAAVRFAHRQGTDEEREYWGRFEPRSPTAIRSQSARARSGRGVTRP